MSNTKHLLNRHTQRFKDEALLVAQDVVPGLSADQLVLLTVVESPAGHAISRNDVVGALNAGALVVRLSKNSFLEPQSSLKVSVLQSLADTFGFAPFSEVLLMPVSDEEAAVDFVEVTFKDQFVSRSLMWRFQRAIFGHCLSIDQNLSILSMTARVAELTCRNTVHGKLRNSSADKSDPAAWVSRKSGLITAQLSMEMWEYTESGGIYFDKFMEFAEEVFKRWNQYQATHSLTIVFFTRSIVHQSGGSQWDSMGSSCEDGLANDIPPVQDGLPSGRKYADFYKLVASNECRSDWTTLLRDIRSEFQVFPAVMGWKTPSSREAQAAEEFSGCVRAQAGRPLGDLTSQPSTAIDGNFLEAINVALNVLDKHYMDRDLRRSGNSIVMLTPGRGVFLVPCKLAEITKQRMMDNGVGMDTISFSKPPLHTVPLFLFREALSREAVTEEGTSMIDLSVGMNMTVGSSYDSADSYTSSGPAGKPIQSHKGGRKKPEMETTTRRQGGRRRRLSDLPYWMNLSYMDAEKINQEYLMYAAAQQSGMPLSQQSSRGEPLRQTIHPLPPLPFPRLLHAVSIAWWENVLGPSGRLYRRKVRSALPMLPSALLAVLYPEKKQLKFLAEDELSHSASDEQIAPKTSPYTLSSDDEGDNTLVQVESQLELLAYHAPSLEMEVKGIQPSRVWHHLCDPILGCPSRISLRKDRAPTSFDMGLLGPGSDRDINGIGGGSFIDEPASPREYSQRPFDGVEIPCSCDIVQMNESGGAERLFEKARGLQGHVVGAGSCSSLDTYFQRLSSGGSMPNAENLKERGQTMGFAPLTERATSSATAVTATKVGNRPSAGSQRSLNPGEPDVPPNGPPISNRPRGEQSETLLSCLETAQETVPATSPWGTIVHAFQSLLGFSSTTEVPQASSESVSRQESETQSTQVLTSPARKHSEQIPIQSISDAPTVAGLQGILRSVGSDDPMRSPPLTGDQRSVISKSLGSRSGRVSFGSSLQVQEVQRQSSGSVDGKNYLEARLQAKVVRRVGKSGTIMTDGTILKQNDSIPSSRRLSDVSDISSISRDSSSYSGHSLRDSLAEHDRKKAAAAEDVIGVKSPNLASNRVRDRKSSGSMRRATQVAAPQKFSRPHSCVAPTGGLSVINGSSGSDTAQRDLYRVPAGLKPVEQTPTKSLSASNSAQFSDPDEGKPHKLVEGYLCGVREYFDPIEELLFKAIQEARSLSASSEKAPSTRPNKINKKESAGAKERNAFVRPKRDAYENTHNRRRWAHVFPRGSEASGGGEGWGPRAIGQKCRGMNWDSLCQPAIMPLTTDYLPNYTQLQENYNFNEYPIELPDPSLNDPMLPAHLNALKSRDELLEELVCQRLTADFQLYIDLRSLDHSSKTKDITIFKAQSFPLPEVVTESPTTRKRPYRRRDRKGMKRGDPTLKPKSNDSPNAGKSLDTKSKPTAEKGVPGSELKGSRTVEQNNLEKFLGLHSNRMRNSGNNIVMTKVLSMGHRVQLLNYTTKGSVIVQLFKYRPKATEEENLSYKYKYALFVNSVGKFLTVHHSFHKYQLPEFGWNHCDRLLCGESTRMDDRVKFKRVRLLILPDWFASSEGFSNYFKMLEKDEATRATVDGDQEVPGSEEQSSETKPREDTESEGLARTFRLLYIRNVCDLLRYLETRVMDPLNGNSIVGDMTFHTDSYVPDPDKKTMATLTRCIPLSPNSGFVVTVVDGDLFANKAFCLEFRWINAASPAIDKLLKNLHRKATDLSITVIQSPQYARGEKIHMHPLIAHPLLCVRHEQTQKLVFERILCSSSLSCVSDRIRDFRAKSLSGDVPVKIVAPQADELAASVKAQTGNWAPRALSEYANMGQRELRKRDSGGSLDSRVVKPGFPPQRVFESEDDALDDTKSSSHDGLGFIHDAEIPTLWDSVLPSDPFAESETDNENASAGSSKIPKFTQLVHLSGGAYVRMGPSGIAFIFSRLPSTKLDPHDADALFSRFKSLCRSMDAKVEFVRVELVQGLVLDAVMKEIDKRAAPRRASAA